MAGGSGYTPNAETGRIRGGADSQTDAGDTPNDATPDPAP